MTPAGIEPAIFRFVAQHLNYCATAVPLNREIQLGNKDFQSIRKLTAENIYIYKQYEDWLCVAQ